VFKAIVNVQRWWGNGQSSSGVVPFEIVCSCGKAMRGRREERHQVVPCAGCGRRLFVLPMSRLPAVGASPFAASSPPPASMLPKRRSPWLWPLLAGGATFVIIAILFGVLLSSRLTSRLGPPPPVDATAAEIDAGLNAARKALNEADFAKAAEDLAGVQATLIRQPDLLSAAETRKVHQMQRQAALVADWRRQPLERLLRNWAPLDDEDWERVVRGRLGQPVMFDVELRCEANGRYQVKFPRPGSEMIRLDLQNLKLLRRLPLNDRQRVLFGARLADVRREAAGVFAVTLEPDSGVLLTDPAVVGAVSLQAPDQALQEVVQKQCRWVAELAP